jgi:hypothetical protein
MTNYAKIDYGDSIAELWGDFTEETVKKEFYRKANQCFGIRKSIMDYTLLEFETDATLPDPWGKLTGASAILKHSGDTIVWDAENEKIKSEWD